MLWRIGADGEDEMTDYDSIQAVNWSTLKHMRDSPAAYKYALENPRADTAAFVFGRAAHTALFEPDTFDSKFAVWSGPRRGKAYDVFKETETRTILTADEAQRARTIAAAVMANDIARGYLKGGIYEKPVYWRDGGTDLQCKGRPDCVNADVLVDFKTAGSTEARRFGAEAARYGYHMQIAHYANGLEHNGYEVNARVIIVAEKQPPHDVAVFVVDDMAFAVAREEVRTLLRRVAECRATGIWPGRYLEVQPLTLPAWADTLELDYDE